MHISQQSLIQSAFKHTIKSFTGLVVISIASGSIFPLAAQADIASIGTASKDISSIPVPVAPLKDALPKDSLKDSASDVSQLSSQQSSAARRIRFRPNVPPPDRGTPRAPYGTGSRSACEQAAETPPLVQLTGNAGMDLTVSEHPSFWVYVPYDPSNVTEATFSLQIEDSEVYQQTIALQDTPGVVEIATPTTLPPLEVGKSYRWYLEVTCPVTDVAEAPTPVTIAGIVQRVTPPTALVNELEIARSPLDKIEAYANHQIWHETLTELAQLRQANPEDQTLTELWKDLLSDPAVGLADWAQLPITGS